MKDVENKKRSLEDSVDRLNDEIVILRANEATSQESQPQVWNIQFWTNLSIDCTYSVVANQHWKFRGWRISKWPVSIQEKQISAEDLKQALEEQLEKHSEAHRELVGQLRDEIDAKTRNIEEVKG